MAVDEPIRFAAVGLNHGHVYAMIDLLRNAGAELAGFHSREDDLAKGFSKQHPDVQRADSMDRIFQDESIQVVVSAAIPDERASIGCAAMRHGKDVMMDKPGATTIEQLKELRQVQSETGRIYSVCYAERLDQRATVAAERMVRNGAIGKVIQTIGLGPHRPALHTRPEWFFDRERYGGILVDIGSHQFDQFLAFTNSTTATIVASRAGNSHHPQHPGFDDFGDAMLQGDSGAAGYIRLDWFTPDGLPTWGDGRLFVLGSEGTIEVRKYVDVAGRPGDSHVYLVDRTGMHYIDCKDEPLQYGPRFLDDVRNRTETAMTQQHCFAATELALRAQVQAVEFKHAG
ncbi:MAG: Gfo/Idh/MocA family protein [Candidatus Sumerlaeaceae bacterium]